MLRRITRTRSRRDDRSIFRRRRTRLTRRRNATAAGEDAAQEFAAPPPVLVEEPTAEAEGERPTGLSVLVADPDAASLRFLEKFLVLSGHRVRCAAGSQS